MSDKTFSGFLQYLSDDEEKYWKEFDFIQSSSEEIKSDDLDFKEFEKDFLKSKLSITGQPLKFEGLGLGTPDPAIANLDQMSNSPNFDEKSTPAPKAGHEEKTEAGTPVKMVENTTKDINRKKLDLAKFEPKSKMMTRNMRRINGLQHKKKKVVEAKTDQNGGPKGKGSDMITV